MSEDFVPRCQAPRDDHIWQAGDGTRTEVSATTVEPLGDWWWNNSRRKQYGGIKCPACLACLDPAWDLHRDTDERVARHEALAFQKEGQRTDSPRRRRS